MPLRSVPVPTPVKVAPRVALPEMGGRTAPEVPPVRDLLVLLLLHLRGGRTTRSGRTRQRRAAEGGYGKSQGAHGEQFFDRITH